MSGGLRWVSQSHHQSGNQHVKDPNTMNNISTQTAGLWIRHLWERNWGWPSTREAEWDDRGGEKDWSEDFPQHTGVHNNIHHDYLSSQLFLSSQVNNATARVVTKKPQTPLVNGEISSKENLCLHVRAEGFWEVLCSSSSQLFVFLCSFWMEDQSCHGSDVCTWALHR